ncbi:MAG: hypothetical protein ACAI44_17075 [Candidatus Sericytochromatia bacterium]
MMTDDRIQRRLSGWELPDDFGQAQHQREPHQDAHPFWLAWVACPAQELPLDLRRTAQFELDQLFCTRRLEEQLPALDWEDLSGPLDSWFGAF